MIIIRTINILLGSLLAVFLLLFLFMQLALRRFNIWVSTPQGALQFMSVAAQEAVLRTTDDGIRYMVIGDETKPALALIHGGFGGFRHRRELSKIQDVYNTYHLIIPERPGYTPGYKHIASSISHEADLLQATLANKSDVTILGISYGAAPAAQLCAQYTGCKTFVGGAGVYFATHHPVYDGLTYVNNTVGRILFPQVFRSALQENIHKNTALDEILPTLQQFDKPTLVFHSPGDPVIPAANSELLMETIMSEKKRLVYTHDIRHQLQDAIPKKLYEEIVEFRETIR